MRRELLLLEEIVAASNRAIDIASRHSADDLTTSLDARDALLWNDTRSAGAGPGTYLISYQAGRGYVIGTRDITTQVVPGPLEQALGVADHTEPVDLLEGEGRGADLVPTSLFDDQLARRLGGQAPGSQPSAIAMVS